jgi:hypothetical protein
LAGAARLGANFRLPFKDRIAIETAHEFLPIGGFACLSLLADHSHPRKKLLQATFLINDNYVQSKNAAPRPLRIGVPLCKMSGGVQSLDLLAFTVCLTNGARALSIQPGATA